MAVDDPILTVMTNQQVWNALGLEAEFGGWGGGEGYMMGGLGEGGEMGWMGVG